MDRQGFSLIELIVIIALISTLLALATLDFTAWQRKSLVERYTKELYSDLQAARARAAFSKRRQSVVLGTQQAEFRSYSSEGDVVGTQVAAKTFPMSFTLNGIWTPPNRIDFDTNGIMSNPVPIAKVICITTTEDAAYDALIITPVFTGMGKVTDRGSACAQTNVTAK